MTRLIIQPRSTNAIPVSFTSIIDELLKENKVIKHQENAAVPKANILENETEFEIQLELAGYNKKNIEINVEKGIITLKGDNRNNDPQRFTNYHINQITEGKFHREFYLPEDTPEDKINARFENGILYVIIPKDQLRHSKRSVTVG